MEANNLTLYVYYKIPANQSDFCLLAVKKLHQSMASRYPSITIQQQKRPNPDTEGQETWMETYAGITQTQLEKLNDELLELAKKYGLPSERKNEIFVSL